MQSRRLLSDFVSWQLDGSVDGPIVLHNSTWDSPLDGILVLDSFAFIDGINDWKHYVAHLLQNMYESTGQRCAVVAQGSITFLKYSWRSSYEYILQCITFFAAPKFMVWVSMGNDLYPPHENMQAYEAPLRGALQQLLRIAMEYCPEHRFVFGGSSEVWQYSYYFSKSHCDEYDRMCAMVRAYLNSQRALYPGLGVITGDPMLKGLTLVDRIGHISSLGLGQLRVFFRMLASWGMAGCSRARL